MKKIQQKKLNNNESNGIFFHALYAISMLVSANKTFLCGAYFIDIIFFVHVHRCCCCWSHNSVLKKSCLIVDLLLSILDFKCRMLRPTKRKKNLFRFFYVCLNWHRRASLRIRIFFYIPFLAKEQMQKARCNEPSPARNRSIKTIGNSVE